jgi:succinate dehydrogenase/fumarate reductase-like Fe-S protein
MKKTITALLLVSNLCFLTSCGINLGVNGSATEGVTEEVETEETEEQETKTEIVRSVWVMPEELEIAETEIAETTEATTEEATIEATTETTIETTKETTAGTTVEPAKVTATSEVNVPSHTHSWDGGTVTQAASCIESGVIVYTCNCGETKTETIGATGHNWVALTTVVHHDAEGEEKQIKVGTRKVVYCDCGEIFYDNESLQPHLAATHDSGTVTTEPVYETRWVETSPSWDETVTTGYICSICGTAQ